ncbi:MAG: ferredoxin reductase [Gaiellaceae bacterium]
MSATDSAETRPTSPAPSQVSPWQVATVEAVTTETYRARTVHVSVPTRPPFRPGQHVDVRLTALDGYQAQRSYSIASAPDIVAGFDLTVELVEDGEVSSWFHQIAEPGDTFELRGPIGGPFTWSVEDDGPIMLIAGGSGVVPLMSMLRHRRARKNLTPALLIYSSRTIDDVIYRDELESLAGADGLDVLHTLTRSQPSGWPGYARRVDDGILGDALDRLGKPRHAFVCGPTPFVENVAAGLVRHGIDARHVRTERFGPSG